MSMTQKQNKQEWKKEFHCLFLLKGKSKHYFDI